MSSRTARASQRPQEAPPDSGPAQPSVRKILVVDDEQPTAEDLAALLREQGYVVEVAFSAEEALARFSVETYHLLITDLLLPGRSGVELTRTVHEACPGCAIILVTGHATVKTAVAALKRGA